jgi:3-oxoadipate enol-lactonase
MTPTTPTGPAPARLYVEDVGAGPTVLALPGLGGGAFFFRGMAARLQTEYRICAVDLPGTGWSDPGEPRTFTIDSWIDDLGRWVVHHGGGPVVIVGHSLGTILALKAWAAWPQLIRGLVFVGGLPRVRPAIATRLTERVENITRHGLTGWGRRAAPGIFSPATFRDRPEIVALFERVFESQSELTYLRSTQLLLGASAAEVPPTIRVPCLAITGADDQYAPPEDVRGFMKQVPGGSRIEVLPDCGHLPFYEAPDAFANAVRTFLRGL